MLSVSAPLMEPAASRVMLGHRGRHTSPARGALGKAIGTVGSKVSSSDEEACTGPKNRSIESTLQPPWSWYHRRSSGAQHSQVLLRQQ